MEAGSPIEAVILVYMHLCIGLYRLHVYARIGLYRPMPVYHLGLYTHVGLYIRPIITARCTLVQSAVLPSYVVRHHHHHHFICPWTKHRNIYICIWSGQDNKAVYTFKLRCLSVCPSVTFRYRDHIGWNSWKIISRPNSLGPVWGVTSTWAIWCNVNTPKNWGWIWVGSLESAKNLQYLRNGAK